MTSSSNPTGIGPFLNPSIVLPKDSTQLLIRLTSFLNEIAQKVNNREISTYEYVETVTGQLWPTVPPSTNRRPVYRTVVAIPAIVAPGANAVPHNLQNYANITFVNIYGTLNIPNTIATPLPQGAPDSINFFIDPVNVNINCATGTYNGATGFAILEYVRN